MPNRNAEYLRVSMALRELEHLKEYDLDIFKAFGILAYDVLDDRRIKLQPSANSKAESPR